MKEKRELELKEANSTNNTNISSQWIHEAERSKAEWMNGRGWNVVCCGLWPASGPLTRRELISWKKTFTPSTLLVQLLNSMANQPKREANPAISKRLINWWSGRKESLLSLKRINGGKEISWLFELIGVKTYNQQRRPHSQREWKRRQSTNQQSTSLFRSSSIVFIHEMKWNEWLPLAGRFNEWINSFTCRGSGLWVFVSSLNPFIHLSFHVLFHCWIRKVNSRRLLVSFFISWLMEQGWRNEVNWINEMKFMPR